MPKPAAAKITWNREQAITAVLCLAIMVVGVLVVVKPSQKPAPIVLSGEKQQIQQLLNQPGAAPIVDFTGDSSVPSVEKPAAININTASQAELEALPYVGPKLAQAIIKARPFSSLADLDARVKGIGPKLLERLEGYIRL
jgi:competence ComEA-like helix-hairpin-helix protein